MNSTLKDHGPVGTKLGTFIIDDELTIENKYISLSLYNKSLIDSINKGLQWMEKKIYNDIQDVKYIKLYQKFKYLIGTYGYTNELNQSIIEASHDILSKLNIVKASIFKSNTNMNDNSGKIIDGRNNNKVPNTNDKIKDVYEPKHSTVKKNHLGPNDLNNITDADVDFSKGLMVQTLPGKYQLFLYVRHNDHWDILPYECICDKIKKIPNLIFNGVKIN